MAGNETVHGIEQFQQKYRLWTRVALTAISALVLGILFGFIIIYEQGAYYRAEIADLKSQMEEDNPDEMDPTQAIFHVPIDEKK